jgi:MoaA/NifB/PqqE/SkfB family radical SAM enzyme
MEVYITITNNCNLNCAHCYCNAGPGKPSLPLNDLKMIIDNFAWNIIDLQISGGEVFTRKKLLYSALEYIKGKRFRKLKRLLVQTNGFWAKNKEIINKNLDRLIKLGVTEIDVSSNDAYHRMAGLDMMRPRLLGKIAKKRRCGDIRKYSALSKFGVFPVGRGKYIKDVYFGKFHRRQVKHLSCLRLTEFKIWINHAGKVYPCCWMIPGTELGDAREEKIVKIIRKALKNKVIHTLIRKNGPVRLAKMVGLNNEEIEKHAKRGECYLCLHLFSNGIIKI